jgi:hypothetical protein
MANTTKLLTNASTISLGLDMFRDGSDQVQAGIATMVNGIDSNRHYSMRWAYGSGDNEVSGVCLLQDMFKGRHHEDGSMDGKFLPAMYRAVAANFGIEGELSSADKMAFQRAFTIASAGWAGVPVTTAAVKILDRKGKPVTAQVIEVPASVAFDLVDDMGAPNELGKGLIERLRGNLELQGLTVPDDDELFERAQELKVRCGGRSHLVFGKVPSASDMANKLSPVAVSNGFMLPKSNRNKSGKSDRFGESLDFVIKCIDEVLGDGDEAGFAPSDAIEQKLHGLAERIAAYFAG